MPKAAEIPDSGTAINLCNSSGKIANLVPKIFGQVNMIKLLKLQENCVFVFEINMWKIT
jgi:hypothetical protein